MAHEIKKAKIKCEFTNGFSLSPNTSTEKALRTILDGVKNGKASEVKLVAEYMDGSEADFELEDEEDYDYDYEDDEDDDEEDDDDEDDDEDDDDEDDDEDDDDDDDDD